MHAYLRTISIAVVMVSGAGLAWVMKPTEKLADIRQSFTLESMVPRQFGHWRIDGSVVPVAPSPDVQAKLDKIYSQTLSRTYINPEGQRVMLSIAYGGDQSDSMQVHFPEVCYASQGFDVSEMGRGTLPGDQTSLPVKRLVARLGNRSEPITYWLVVGDTAVASGTKQKFAQLKYGLIGKVPDGFLVRVSTIDPDKSVAYEVQAEFIKAMLAAMQSDDRMRLVGRDRPLS